MLTIRKVKVSEMDALRDLMESTFRAAFEAQNRPEDFKKYVDEAFAIEEVVAELTHPDSEFWFALLEDETVAYLKLNFVEQTPKMGPLRTVQIERLYVRAAFQGLRIGEELLEFAENRAARFRAVWLWLSVWQENPRALKFYQRCGYEVYGTEVFTVGTDDQTDWLVKKRVK